MAQTSSNRDWRGLQINLGFLVGFVAAIVAVVAAVAGFQYWLDSRIDTRVSSYADSSIFPRIKQNEVEIKQLRIELTKIASMIETQDHTRNRQYGEMKKISEENNEKLQKVIDHLLVNK